MLQSANDNLTAAKTNPQGPGQEGYVDIHCHCLPAIDDGPATMADALALCRALVDDGITTAVATPHQLGRFNDSNDASKIRKQVSALNEELKSNGIALTVMPGADVRVDERICQLLEDDKILTLADGGKYMLLELPHQVFIDIEPLLVELSSRGIQPIISHPERHPTLAREPKILFKWLKHSAHLQITAASLLGEFGPEAQSSAWQFISSGWTSVVATDCHDVTSRRPCMKATFKHICIKLSWTIAWLVCIENPSRILKSQDMLIVPSSTASCKFSPPTTPVYKHKEMI